MVDHGKKEEKELMPVRKSKALNYADGENRWWPGLLLLLGPSVPCRRFFLSPARPFPSVPNFHPPLLPVTLISF